MNRKAFIEACDEKLHKFLEASTDEEARKYFDSLIRTYQGNLEAVVKSRARNKYAEANIPDIIQKAHFNLYNRLTKIREAIEKAKDGIEIPGSIKPIENLPPYVNAIARNAYLEFAREHIPGYERLNMTITSLCRKPPFRIFRSRADDSLYVGLEAWNIKDLNSTGVITGEIIERHTQKTLKNMLLELLNAAQKPLPLDKITDYCANQWNRYVTDRPAQATSLNALDDMIVTSPEQVEDQVNNRLLIQQIGIFLNRVSSDERLILTLTLLMDSNVNFDPIIRNAIQELSGRLNISTDDIRKELIPDRSQKNKTSDNKDSDKKEFASTVDTLAKWLGISKAKVYAMRENARRKLREWLRASVVDQ